MIPEISVHQHKKSLFLPHTKPNVVHEASSLTCDSEIQVLSLWDVAIWTPCFQGHWSKGEKK